MQTVRMSDAQSHLPELLDSVAAGDEIVITRDEKPVAKLTASEETSLQDIRPTSVGAILRPLSPDDDLLEEMTQHDRH